MNVRVVLRIVAILVLAVLASLLLRGLFAAPAQAPKPPMASIAVAPALLPIGTLLKPDDLGWREVPLAEVQKGQIAKDSPAAAKLSGAVVRRAIDDGAVINERDVVYADAPGFLAAALQPGMRAVSVAIDDVTGNAGLTLPGDRVDLILTHHMTNPDNSSGPPKVASETVLADVRVIAVGHVLRVPDSDAPNAPAPSTTGARTVTLEVGPRDAESVAVVSRLGQLSLALRSLAVTRGEGDAAAEPKAPVWGKDISQVVRMSAEPERRETHRTSAPAAPAAPAQVQVFRGSGNK